MYTCNSQTSSEKIDGNESVYSLILVDTRLYCIGEVLLALMLLSEKEIKGKIKI